MAEKYLKINKASITNELKPYSDKPYLCLFEYIWNSFDAKAKMVTKEHSN